MRVVVAPDSFGGTWSAAEAAARLAAGWRRARPADEVVEVPMADGGEGTLAVVATALGLADAVERATVTGPLGEPVEAAWLPLPDGTALVESAAACGLALVPPACRDVRRATTYGVGELVLATGRDRVVLGLGGSATVDGGRGFLAALAAAGRRPGDLLGLADVATVLGDAAATYGPQKGATPADVRALAVELAALGAAHPEHAAAPGSGAAGGLGFAVLVAGGRLVPGAAWVAGVAGLPAAVAGADLVVTGEGRLDATSLHGKVMAHVAAVALAAGVPCVAIAGAVEAGRRELGAAGLAAAYAAGPDLPGAAEAVARGWSR